ncbi:hypothetical protein ABZV91_29060 [Nocardia sp. NPDC004568]|uniref:hypothetical protein n=1 Tax=Nocardia sp. NPDC004568 TaxID=3154551 RepID=UPI0033AF7A55
MSGKLWVDPAGLKARAAAFQELGAEMQQVVARLQAALAAEGRWWGEDESGEQFGQYYEPDADKAISALQEIATALNGFGTQVAQSADTVTAADVVGREQIENAPYSTDPTARPAAAEDIAGPLQPAASAGGPDQVGPNSVTGPGDPDQVAQNSVTSPAAPAAPGVTPDPSSGGGAPGSEGAEPGTSGQAEGPEAGQPGTPGGDPARNRNERQSPERAQTPVGGPRTVERPGPAGGPPGAPGGPARQVAQRPGGSPGGATQPPRVTAGGDGKPPGSPGSGRPASSGPTDSVPPSVPGQRNDNRNDNKPAKDDKAAPGRPERGQATDGARPGPSAPKPVETPLMRAARQLSDRHGVTVAGFENDELDETVVGEFLTATDDVLTRYPVLALREVGIGAVVAADIVEARPCPEPGDARRSPSPWDITFDAGLAADPERLAEIVLEKRRPGRTVVGPEVSPAYEATIREFGRAFDRAGDRLAHGLAQRALIADYLSGASGHRESGLARQVAGYRRWRDQLSDSCFEDGLFDPGAALVEAFTDVMLNGDGASEPATTLCRLLAATAETNLAEDPGSGEEVRNRT